jgi:hypothetical protein
MLSSWRQWLALTVVSAGVTAMASCDGDSSPDHVAEQAGSGGTAAGGSGGLAGGGGMAGRGGTGGSAASGGRGGTAGASGSAGSAGTIGTGGVGGGGGSAGTTGTGGMAGKGDGGGAVGAFGIPMFPADSVFVTPIDTLSVHPSSAAWIRSQDFSTDPGTVFWAASKTSGFYYNVVDDTASEHDVYFLYGPQSDFCYGSTSSTTYSKSSVKYSIPEDVRIETGGPNTDNHAFIINRATKKLYEIHHLYLPKNPDGSYNARAGAVYDLTSNQLRGGINNPQMDGHVYGLPRAGATVGGFSSAATQVNYEEVVSGEIRHVIHAAVPWTAASYIWPGRGIAGSCTEDLHHGDLCPPMGARFRLKSSFNLDGYPPQSKVILSALKKYGMILGDNAPKPPNYAGDKRLVWIGGFVNSKWDQDDLNWIQKVKITDLEFVDESPLMIDPDSGQARQP